MGNKTNISIGVVAAAILSAVPFIADLEGDKLSSYQDTAGVWTVCSGETLGVAKGDTLTQAQCNALTQSRVGQFMLQVTPLLRVPVGADTLAAHTSFAYNIGIVAYRRSSALRFTNAGNIVSGCKAMALWNTVDGKVNTGLVNRRNKEIALCERGIK